MAKASDSALASVGKRMKIGFVFAAGATLLAGVAAIWGASKLIDAGGNTLTPNAQRRYDSALDRVNVQPEFSSINMGKEVPAAGAETVMGVELNHNGPRAMRIRAERMGMPMARGNPTMSEEAGELDPSATPMSMGA